MAINHADCNHPQTPAGRRACRAAGGATPKVVPVTAPMISVPLSTEPKPGNMMAPKVARHAECSHPATARARATCDRNALMATIAPTLDPGDLRAGSVVLALLPVIDGEPGEMVETLCTIAEANVRDNRPVWVLKSDSYVSLRWCTPEQIVSIISI